MQQQMHKQLEIQTPIGNQLYKYTSSMPFNSYGVRDDARASNKFSVSLRNENGTSLPDPIGGHRYMLFGVNLVKGSPELLKFGTDLGRSIDLYRFNGYGDLICELDGMFDFNERLTDGTSGWHVTYIDKDRDMMLIADHYPWQKFQYEVRRMVILPKEETDRPNSSSPNSASY